MSDNKVLNRWFVVVGAVLIQLCLGAIYAWSVFTPPLQAAGWTKAQTQFVFSAGLVSFAVVMVLAGYYLMPRLGPRRLCIAGGAVLGAGYILGGLLGGTSVAMLVFFIGIVGGAGIGLAYVVPIAVGMRWFPDKKGLITGLAVAGFGFGAMLWVKLAGAWGRLIETIGLSNTFAVYGTAFLVLIAIGGVWMVFPPRGWRPAGWIPPAAGAAVVPDAVSFEAGRMLGTAQFYLIFTAFVFSSGAGLMTIGLMKLFPREALQAAGMGEAAASAAAGTAMAVFFSLANGFGRIAWGSLSDRLGRRMSVVVMCLSQGIFVIAFTKMAGTPAMLYLGAALIGFNFGGNFALFPTITADTFGSRNIAQLYPLVFLAYGAGGIGGPIFGGRLGDLGNFPLAFTVCGVLCFAASLLSLMLRPVAAPPCVAVDEHPADAETESEQLQLVGAGASS
jgi:OFA family oxalate/formate antiporter-like MFS transporter